MDGEKSGWIKVLYVNKGPAGQYILNMIMELSNGVVILEHRENTKWFS